MNETLITVMMSAAAGVLGQTATNTLPHRNGADNPTLRNRPR